MGDPISQSKERAAFPSKPNGEMNGHSNGHSALNIIDIRSDKEELSLGEVLRTCLKHDGSDGGERTLPDLLLWDAEGLKLFEQITYLPSYYLTNQEIELLEQSADSIAEAILPGSMLIELGSGNLRKIKILLDALERIGKSVDYYALDLDKSELERTLSMVPSSQYKHVTMNGLYGSYDDGMHWLQNDKQAQEKPKCILSLGSTIGSFARPDAADFLGKFAKSVRDGGSGTVLLAVDGNKNGDEVWKAYNDTQGINAKFIANALKHANNILKYDAFKEDEWTVKGEWNENNGSHDWWYIPLQDVSVEGAKFKKGERIRAVRSYKYDAHDRHELYRDAQVKEVKAWLLHGKEYGIYQVTSTS